MGSSTGDFERWMKGVLGMESLSLSFSLFEEVKCGGGLGRAPLLRTAQDMLSNALEWASVSIGAPRLGNMEGRYFLRAFEIKRCIKRYVKMPCQQAYLSIGVPLGNLEKICLPGRFG
jgi:hypothetical protein